MRGLEIIHSHLTYINISRVTLQERFADLLAAQDITIPSQQDFNAADLNKDGTLIFEEWQEWVKEQVEGSGTSGEEGTSEEVGASAAEGA